MSDRPTGRTPDPAPAPTEPEDGLRELDARIDRFARRRARARLRRGKSLWAQATAVGTLGWLIAVPIAAGAILGHLLDRRLGSGITWSMAFMFLGVLVGGYALWKVGFDARTQAEAEQAEAEPVEVEQARRDRGDPS